MIIGSDKGFILDAVRMARLGLGHTRPNPSVGAVIVKDEKIIASGYHKKAGLDHAEVDAIKNAKENGVDIEGATIYVTLEPCSTVGKVGACTDAIIASGIKRVVYAYEDPNPKNQGKAKLALEKVGVECDYYDISKLNEDDELRQSLESLMRPFAKHITTSLPYVIVKLAMSLDGKICDNSGYAKWISSDKSRERTGQFRLECDAIMVGGETIRKDNPSLLSHSTENPDLIRVVISKSGNLPKDAQVFTDKKNTTLVFDDAETAIKELGKMGCLSVICEGGLKLARSLADSKLVDEWITVLSPIVIGDKKLNEALHFKGDDYVYRACTENR